MRSGEDETTAFGFWKLMHRMFHREQTLPAFSFAGFNRDFDPNDWKPMTDIGPGVREIRIQTGMEHRVFYVAKFPEAIYVLHAFQKRTRKTPKRELQLARDRFRDLLKRRRLQDDTKPQG